MAAGVLLRDLVWQWCGMDVFELMWSVALQAGRESRHDADGQRPSSNIRQFILEMIAAHPRWKVPWSHESSTGGASEVAGLLRQNTLRGEGDQSQSCTLSD
jgi:hypothetical protein